MLSNIPRLLAEDQLIEIQSISIGSGNLPRAAQTREFERLRALVDDKPIEPRRSTPSEMLQFAQRTAQVKVVAASG